MFSLKYLYWLLFPLENRLMVEISKGMVQLPDDSSINCCHLCLTMLHFLTYILLYWSDYKIKILLKNTFYLTGEKSSEDFRHDLFVSFSANVMSDRIFQESCLYQGNKYRRCQGPLPLCSNQPGPPSLRYTLRHNKEKSKQS